MLAPSNGGAGNPKPETSRDQKTMNTEGNTPPDVRAYLAKIGRKGGKSKSPAKLAAIRKNAKKGGRPRKTG